MKPPRLNGHTMYQCRVSWDDRSREILRRAEADGSVSADHFVVRGRQIEVPLRPREIALLRRLGVTVRVGRDLAKRARQVAGQQARAPGRERLQRLRAGGDDSPGSDDALLTGFVSGYLDAAEITAHFAALHAEFPALTEWTDLPFATSGYDGSVAALLGPSPIKLFRITTTPASTAKPGLLLIAGCHAREWIPPLAAIEFAEQLLRNYDPASANADVVAINQIVEGLDVLIVPAMNPDGVNFSRHDDPFWRKNRRANPPSLCRGADNNRNYTIYWGGAGSGGTPCTDTFRGPAALSEPENQAIAHLVEAFPNIVIAVDVHSAGEKILRPQPAGGAFIAMEPVDPADDLVYQDLESAINTGVGSVSPGKTYLTGSTSNHAGTTDEYLYFAHRIFAFDLECGVEWQPPIADAQVSAQEVAAAARQLGARALTLAAEFPAPAAIVQVIDRSGSMISSGYVEGTRANARRLVDLMSYNDSVGVVSFNQAAATEYPLTPIDAPGVWVEARAAIDGIVFGGLTSIGGGLAAGGAALAGVAGKRSLILLSDGYHNFPPSPASALAGLPADVAVHTIALGPASDQALLQSIATDTGGTYYFSPDDMELYEIYNFVRAAVMDDQVAYNETFDADGAGTDDDEGRQMVVDQGARQALFSVALHTPMASAHVSIAPPSTGLPVLTATLDGRRPHGVFRVRQPRAGVWRLRVQTTAQPGRRVRCTAAAFLRSDLRLVLEPRRSSQGRAAELAIAVLQDGMLRSFVGTTTITSAPVSVRQLARRVSAKLSRLHDFGDPIASHLGKALLKRDGLYRETGADPLAPRRRPGPSLAVHGAELVSPRAKQATPLRQRPDAARRGVGMITLAIDPIDVTHNVRVRVESTSNAVETAFVREWMVSVLP